MAFGAQAGPTRRLRAAVTILQAAILQIARVNDDRARREDLGNTLRATTVRRRSVLCPCPVPNSWLRGPLARETAFPT